jgi:uncharacterized protein
MIRSLTLGLPVSAAAPSMIAEQASIFIDQAQNYFSKAGISPRTIRFTLPPLGPNGEVEGAISNLLCWVDELASKTSTRWICLPLDFVTPGIRRERLLGSLDAIKRFPRVFFNLIIAEKGNIAIEGVNDAALFILQLSKKSNNGFDGFRVGASANCPANAPFFPFSRHEGEGLVFSLALETTSIALKVMANPEIRRTRDLMLIREHMIAELTPVLHNINDIGCQLSEKSGVEYRGLDASFAPFPDGQMSVGALIEEILGAQVGSNGSVFITALLTDVLRAALRASGARAVGFNGVMFSVLEDERLAAANSRRGTSVDGLTALAAVCGCGIDMVPVPGLSFQEEIAAVILDIAGLSSTLNKPLGVRLLPIPNKSVNEFTQFNTDFLCDSRVMALSSNDHRFRIHQHLLDFKAPLWGIHRD